MEVDTDKRDGQTWDIKQDSPGRWEGVEKDVNQCSLHERKIIATGKTVIRDEQL